MLGRMRCLLFSRFALLREVGKFNKGLVEKFYNLVLLVADMSYRELKEEHKNILGRLGDKRVYDYILKNMETSLSSLGFSREFIEYFVGNFSDFDFEGFYDKFGKEIDVVYDEGYYQKIVPEFYSREVVPHIPKTDKILDLGCGTGILVYTLSKEQKFKELIGMDIVVYPEWGYFRNPKIRFEVVKEKGFASFLKELNPDSVVLTYVLHHMDYEEQLRYLGEIFQIIGKGDRLVILEDSYSEKLSPENGEYLCDSFMKFSLSERKLIMSVYDWIANRILARRHFTPIPFGYRTLEEWERVCEEIGYKVIDKVFIGFPDKIDINTPRSLLIIEK